MGQDILIEHRRAPGDIVVLSGAIRDLVKANPDKFNITVNTSCPSLWKHNPYVKTIKASSTGHRRIRATYGSFIRTANTERLHFARAFHRNLEKQLQVPCPVLQQYGDLYLDDWHKENPPMAGRYWYIIAGGKNDFPVKIWSSLQWQQTINILTEFGVRFVQDGALHTGHVQPPMQNVLSTISRTNLRDMLWLIYHAEGVICHVTCAMHIAAAFNKPCVTIAGGREHWWWEAYSNVAIPEQFGEQCAPIGVPHRFLHTQDLLDCCTGRGCWKNKVVNNGNHRPDVLCKRPLKDSFGQDVPECMMMIKPEHVVEAVMSYYEDGTLPPIGQPKKIILPSGKEIVPGTLSEKTPVRPMFANSPGFVDLFASPKTLEPAETNIRVSQLAPEEIRQLHRFEREQDTGTNEEKAPPSDVFDNDIIGGRVTICVLLYGDYFDLHRKCINSILSTVPLNRMQLRVAGNEICQDTQQYLARLKAEDRIYKTYIDPLNIKKYPAMRKMFHDQEDPITDKYVVWFDDDTIADKDTQWFTKLCITIGKNHKDNYRYYGAKFIWNLTPTQLTWVKDRPWYRGKSFQMKNGLEAPNANKVVFATGGFWAAEMAAIRAADVPDAQIGHNGGDYMVGEQLWQHGANLKDWNHNKMFVHTSSVKRRGLNEVHTGQAGWAAGGVAK